MNFTSVCLCLLFRSNQKVYDKYLSIRLFISFSRTIVSGGCLKSNKHNINQKKKSVHFDWHLPTEVQTSSPTTRSNYRLPVTVTSSSMFTSNSDNDEQKKKIHGETGEEKEKNETTRRTLIITTIPLTTNTIHRSFSLSPSPPSKKENNDSRRFRQEKKENVDELNCPTSRQVTTAATHLYCTTNTATVTGNYNISPNGTNNSHTSMTDLFF